MNENEGRRLANKYSKIIDNMKKPIKEEKSGDEIAKEIISKNGLNFNGCI